MKSKKIHWANISKQLKKQYPDLDDTDWYYIQISFIVFYQMLEFEYDNNEKIEEFVKMFISIKGPKNEDNRH